MKGKLDRAAKRIIGTLFIPAKVTTERLSILAWCWIVLLLGGTVLLAEPHIRQLVAEYILRVSRLNLTTKERGKEYCDFAFLIFQVLMVITIGGIVITDEIVARAQRLAKSVEEAERSVIAAEHKRLQWDLFRSYVRMKKEARGTTFWTFPRKLFLLIRLANNVSDLAVENASFIVNTMLAFRFSTSFPKGVYGHFGPQCVLGAISLSGGKDVLRLSSYVLLTCSTDPSTK